MRHALYAPELPRGRAAAAQEGTPAGACQPWSGARQVLDARDPLRYRSADLEAYAAELHPAKRSLLLLNKADLLPRRLRAAWAAYFGAQGLDHVFWSAKAAADALQGDGAPRARKLAVVCACPARLAPSLSCTIAYASLQSALQVTVRVCSALAWQATVPRYYSLCKTHEPNGARENDAKRARQPGSAHEP